MIRRTLSHPLLSARPRQAGMTLIEIIVVVVLLGIMTLIVYGTIRNITETKRLVEDQRSLVRSARFILGKMIGELSSKSSQSLRADEQGGEQDEGQDEDQDLSGGAFGANPTSPYARSTGSFMLGKSAQGEKSDVDELRFVSNVASNSMLGPLGNNGALEIRYRLKEIKTAKEVSEAGYTRFVLLREEAPSGIEEKEVLEKRTVSWPLVDNVVSLNFRYLKNEKWLEEWKATDFGFPEVIEITLKVVSEKGKIEAFRTAVAMSEKKPRFGGNPY